MELWAPIHGGHNVLVTVERYASLAAWDEYNSTATRYPALVSAVFDGIYPTTHRPVRHGDPGRHRQERGQVAMAADPKRSGRRGAHELDMAASPAHRSLQLHRHRGHGPGERRAARRRHRGRDLARRRRARSACTRTRRTCAAGPSRGSSSSSASGPRPGPHLGRTREATRPERQPRCRLRRGRARPHPSDWTSVRGSRS